MKKRILALIAAVVLGTAFASGGGGLWMDGGKPAPQSGGGGLWMD